MKTPIASDNLSTMQSPIKRLPLSNSFLKIHSKRINDELKANGAVTYDLLLPETHYLPFVIKPDEHVMGSVYGKYPKGRGALIATDQRILFVDKKPLFVHVDAIDFAVVGGITRTQAGPSGIVILHTQMGDYNIRTFNQKNAINFVEYIETKCLRNKLLNQSLKGKFIYGADDDNTT